MLPAVRGLCGLDIGCGEGANTRDLSRLGAVMQAVDVAPTFIRHAEDEERASPLGIRYHVADAMELPFAERSFDFVTAFMSLMDMPDPAKAVSEAQRVLRPGGFLQFSILHPCFVPRHRRVMRGEAGSVRAIEIAGYFDGLDGRVDTWWFSTLPEEERLQASPFRTPRFHRTLSQWVEMICGAGLRIEQMAEPSAGADLALAEPILADTRIAPLFLHVRASRPS